MLRIVRARLMDVARISIGAPDEDVLSLQVVARGSVGQIWNAQMRRRDPRQTRVVRVQRGCHSRKAGHQAVGSDIFPIGAAQQRFDLTPVANHETMIAPLD
jgi:hypothetical protein